MQFFNNEIIVFSEDSDRLGVTSFAHTRIKPINYKQMQVGIDFNVLAECLPFSLYSVSYSVVQRVHCPLCPVINVANAGN